MKFFNVFLFSVVLLLVQPCITRAQQPPNILWIVSEDNSASYIGTYGNSLADTPNIDRLAGQSVVYDNAFATTPVCAPSRFTLITGMYANAMGTENMRSTYKLPDFIKFYPKYLKQAGYYTTNNSKKDYNTVDQPGAWDESSDTATYKNRNPGQPFFHIKNLHETHESRIHGTYDTLRHNPDRLSVPPYLPSTQSVKRDLAHYYDKVTEMDARVGQILKELKESGEADNTIVFYYSDHGGVLPRSKRFMFESGLHIPLMVHFPPKYSNLAPDKKRTDRLVTFIDFAPTLLSLAGVKPPDYMQGKAFLGKYSTPPKKYVHMYRARMDERYDLIRTVRSRRYLYVHNYMPQRIYGQHLEYLWKASSMQSWQDEYEKANLNEVQRRFFQAKPVEELYKISSDPHNVHNLAGDPGYSDVLRRMRRENLRWMKKTDDLGVIPEETIDSVRQDRSLYSAVREDDYPIDEVIETADRASRATSENLDQLAGKLDDPNDAIRFWAATAFSVADPQPEKYEGLLAAHAGDASSTVRIAIAEALYRYGDTSGALSILKHELNTAPGYAKVRALNTLQALGPQIESAEFRQTLNRLVRDYDTESAPKKYVHRAAKYLLKTAVK